MRPTPALCVVAALTFSGTLFGQAIIGYGVNVGRAGAAGAATGAGAAGIFTGVQGTLDQQDPKKGAEAPRQAKVEAGVEKKDKEDSNDKSANAQESQESKVAGEEKSEAPASWISGTLTTSTGFVISGLQRRPTRSGYGPSASGPVVKVADAEPSAVPPAVASNSPDTNASNPPVQPATGASQPTSPASSGVFEPIVTQFGTARGEPRHAGSEAAAAATVEIPLGTSITDLVKRFGDPLLAMTGISGEEYTEKYVFRAPDGARLTVLSVNGKVTAFMLDPDNDASRAAL